MDRQADARRLNVIRKRVGLLDGVRLMRVEQDGETLIDAHGADGSVVTIARPTGHAAPEEIDLLVSSLDDARFLLGLLDRAFDAVRRARPAPAEPEPARRDHTTEAAMLCGTPVFQQFLAECHGLDAPLNKGRAAARLRSVLAIDSRKTINTDEGARDRWLSLRRDFYAWKGRAVT